MKKILLTFLFFFLSSGYTFPNEQHARSIEARKQELTNFLSRPAEPEVMQKKALELLSLDNFNRTAIRYLLLGYQELDQPEAITDFWDKLVKDHKDEPKPYVLRAILSDYESLTYRERLGYLEKAYALAPEHVEVNYLLSCVYYDFFRKEFSKNKRKETVIPYAEKAVLYMQRTCSFDKKYQEKLKWPLIQLSNYLGDTAALAQARTYDTQTSYFPLSELIVLPDDWTTNFTVDVLDKVDSAIFSLDWYSSHLAALEEPVLRDLRHKKVYRFTWLRSFNPPIAIRLENEDGATTLYWKECDGAGGYRPGKLIVNKKKKLTGGDWRKFIAQIQAVKFWSLPSGSGGGGFDGAQWILEGMEAGRYHVVDRWLGGEIASICLELLGMTDLKIPDKDVY
jgi:tetratricopeptide (TPR) repeat protein